MRCQVWIFTKISPMGAEALPKVSYIIYQLHRKLHYYEVSEKSVTWESWSDQARRWSVPVAVGVGGWNAPTTISDALSRNLQNIKDKLAHQPAKRRETPYHIHVLPLLNRRRWKQLLSNVCVPAGCCVQCCRAHYAIELLILWSWQMRFLTLTHT